MNTLILILAIYAAVISTFLLYYRLRIFYAKREAAKTITHNFKVVEEELLGDVEPPYIIDGKLKDKPEPELVEEREWRNEQTYITKEDKSGNI